MTTEKILDKVRKLRAKAESCHKIGSEAEAQTFAAAVQRLLTEHKLSMTEVEMAADPLGYEYVNHQAYGLPTKRVRVAWSERLAKLVARHHYCRIFVESGSNRVAFVGRRSDTQVAEYLFVTLYRLMESMAEREYVRYFYECKEEGDVTQARGFKGGWLLGFITRLSERLERERKAQHAEILATAKPDALLRVDNALALVNQYMKDLGSTRGTSLQGRMTFHHEGMSRGRRAAEGISLRGNALEATGRKPKLLGGGR